MAKSIVEKCTFVQEWEFQGNKNYNFVVKFKNSDDRFVYVGKDKDNPKFVENQEVEYTILDKKIKVFVGDKTFEYPKIEVAKQAFGGGGFSGGGKSYTKTPETYRNEMVSYCSSYAKDILCHKISLGGATTESIIKAYEELVDGFVKASNKHIK